jgi:uridine phosphorylase
MTTTELLTERFAESELILDDEKRIYHLHLHPEEIADTIITVGDPNRVPLVSRYFDSIELKRSKRELITHTGYVGRKRVSVVSTGMGTGNIDIVMHELDALVNIDFNTRHMKDKLKSLTIIRIGTAGALQADIPVDSTVISASALGFDNLLRYYNYTNTPKELQLKKAVQAYFKNLEPYVVSGNDDLVKYFATPDTFTGITATCTGFYGPQGRKLRSNLQFPDFIEELQAFRFGEQRVVNFEMETAAIYGLASIMGHRALSVSAIVANRASQVFSQDGKQTVNRLIEKTIAQIAAFEVPADATA